jgi:hypothetical protein
MHVKTIRKTEGKESRFIMADLEPAYEKVLQDLQYPRSEDGFGRAFPADTPHLDRIYLNFQRYAEEMLLQAAGVRPVPWEQALTAFLQIVEHQNIDWWLTGSAALSVRGVDIVPHDFDLVVDDAGAQRLGELLLPYVYEPVVPVHDWICNWFGRAFLYARFEWVGGVRASMDEHGVSDAGPTAARRLETVIWHGKEVRLPPLDLQLDVSERRGLTERVEMIQRLVSNQV